MGEIFRAQTALTYVIANRFPDLAIRGRSGEIGLRFEVKAIQSVSEETAANFDAILKDLRKGSDYVVVLLWEWRDNPDGSSKYPHIEGCFVFDAYHLAQMRDCSWLNRPPPQLGNGRQGFDLCYGVNCRAGAFNKEEGNFGKLMRIFRADFEKYLPNEVRQGSTLKEYDRFCHQVLLKGLKTVAVDIANQFPGDKKISCYVDGLPVIVVVDLSGVRVLIVGEANMPTRSVATSLMQQYGARVAVLLNGKFDCRVRTDDWSTIAEGRKPMVAKDWAMNWGEGDTSSG